MRLLIDSNVFVFLAQHPDVVPPRAMAALRDPANRRYLSVVTPWELQIKTSLGRFDFGKPIRDVVQFDLDRGAFDLLPITLDHVEALSRLPNHHRDPFDRLLIAQAIHEGLTLVTSDRQIARYPAPVLWD